MAIQTLPGHMNIETIKNYRTKIIQLLLRPHDPNYATCESISCVGGLAASLADHSDQSSNSPRHLHSWLTMRANFDMVWVGSETGRSFKQNLRNVCMDQSQPEAAVGRRAAMGRI